MKKLSESVWGDIRKRGIGADTKQEDAFNPDYVDFGENTTVYWAIDNLEIDGEVKFNFDDVKDYNNNGWRLPTVDEVNQLKWNIRIAWRSGRKHLKFDDGNELILKTDGYGGFHMWTKEINTKFPTGAYAYGFDNSYNFDVTSFNKSINKLFVFLVKDKNYVSESVWGDIRKRGIGSSEKQEDTFNPDYIDFGDDTTVYWAIDNLQIDGKVKFQFDEVRVYNNNGWRLPTKEEVEQLNWDGAKLQYKIGFKYFIFPDGNKLEIRTNGEGGNRMWTSEIVEKYPTGAWGYGLNNAGKYASDPFNRGTKLFVFLVKDKNYVSESVWNDIRKRGIGTDVKQEDDLTNIRELKPIDMGVSVLWADKDLEHIDGNPYFSYTEIEGHIKKSNWRLPTKEETSELFKYTRIMKNTDEVCILEGDFDGGPQLIFYKNGYKLGDSDQLYKDYCYCCWTSTECETAPEAYFMFNVYQHQSHIPMHKENRVPVRLVRDK